MNDALKWLLKVALHAVLWVFLLSIKVDGRPAFTYANEVLVQNSLVRAVDDELGDLWYRLSRTAKTTFSKSNQEDGKPM
jgi:hypothetical protein